MDDSSKASPGAWLYEKTRLEWIKHSDVRSQLPALHRLFCYYCLLSSRISDRGYVRGGERAFRVVRRITKSFSLPDHS